MRSYAVGETTEWITRWKYEISAKPLRPGVWGLKDGGFLVRTRALDPVGKVKEHMRALRGVTLEEAEREKYRLQTTARVQLREPDALPPLWLEYARSLFEEKVNEGRIKSAKSRERWASTLARLSPFIGGLYVDEVTRERLLEWRSQMAKWIARGMPSVRERDKTRKRKKKIVPLAPATANGWMSILKVVCAAMTDRLDLPRDPAAKLQSFPNTHETYTEEQPNALTPEESRAFCEKLKELFPQHYAIVMLGFSLGSRPSTLRPLRRRGPKADIGWNDDPNGAGFVRLRRSHTRGQEVMEQTKTGRKQRIPLPASMMAIPHEHVKSLEGPMAESDLLFPAITGGLRSSSSLDKPFRAVTAALGWSLKLTPRGMRRTFQDTTRDGGVEGVVTRAISGHQTEEMQEHYSTARQKEMLAAVTSVVSTLLPERPATDADAPQTAAARTDESHRT
jgi:hypothetical protein